MWFGVDHASPTWSKRWLAACSGAKSGTCANAKTSTYDYIYIYIYDVLLVGTCWEYLVEKGVFHHQEKGVHVYILCHTMILGNRGNNWSPRPHKHTKVPTVGQDIGYFCRWNMAKSLNHHQSSWPKISFAHPNIGSFMVSGWIIFGWHIFPPWSKNGQILIHSTLFPGSILVPQMFLRFVQIWILSCTVICE